MGPITKLDYNYNYNYASRKTLDYNYNYNYANTQTLDYNYNYGYTPLIFFNHNYNYDYVLQLQLQLRLQTKDVCTTYVNVTTHITFCVFLFTNIVKVHIRYINDSQVVKLRYVCESDSYIFKIFVLQNTMYIL